MKIAILKCGHPHWANVKKKRSQSMIEQWETGTFGPQRLLFSYIPLQLIPYLFHSLVEIRIRYLLGLELAKGWHMWRFTRF